MERRLTPSKSPVLSILKSSDNVFGTDNKLVNTATLPGGIPETDLDIVVNSAPNGVFPPGSTFSYDLTIDTASLPDSEVGFAFRPVDEFFFGTVTPANASIVSSTSTCG